MRFGSEMGRSFGIRQRIAVRSASLLDFWLGAIPLNSMLASFRDVHEYKESPEPWPS
jgi:hypothetical protein